jgi:dolichol-phosphate mannosyltransferase
LAAFNLIVVDGGSKDRTSLIAKKMGGKVLNQIGKGKGDAISQALKNVEGKPDFIIFIDADYTYPAKYLEIMLKTITNRPDVGMVIGNRFDKFLKPKGMKNPYYAGNRMLALAQYFLNGIKLSDPLTGLRIVRWEILKEWEPKSKGFDIEVELNHFIEHSGMNIIEIPIKYRDRLGEKKLGLRHGFRILKRIISESYNFPKLYSNN